MATAVIMPRFGQSVESCVITGWAKQVGETVHTGDTLFTYETDKASFDEEAKVDGTLLAVFFQEQDDVPCLETVAVIGEPGEDISSFAPGGAAETGSASPESASTAPAAPAAEAAPTPLPQVDAAGVSPRARAAAERLHVDLSHVAPSGPHGRIIERDVLSAQRATSAAFAAGGAADIQGTGLGGRVTLGDLASPQAAPQPSPAAPAAEYRDEKASHMRRIIAKSMHDSLAVMAQLTHHSSFDASAIIAYRRQLKSSGKESLAGITYNDIVLYAVSRVLKNHPVLNAHWLNESETIRYFDHVHLGMAVDTPRGLLVPTLFNADTKSLAQISREAKELAAAAQSGSISPDLLKGATFTVSNLGTLDIELFTPVINPPQTGILGVDCMVDRVRSVDGQLSVYPAMGISLTYDHRAMDGAPASRFLKELKTALEQFTALLAE